MRRTEASRCDGQFYSIHTCIHDILYIHTSYCIYICIVHTLCVWEREDEDEDEEGKGDVRLAVARRRNMTRDVEHSRYMFVCSQCWINVGTRLTFSVGHSFGPKRLEESRVVATNTPGAPMNIFLNL